jgi:hypothetical protein
MKLDEVTLGDLRKSLVRYRPFLGVVVAIAALMVVLPGKDSPQGGSTNANAAGTPYALSGGSGPSGGSGDAATGGGAAGASTTPTGGATTAPTVSSGGGTVGGGGGSAGGTGSGSGSGGTVGGGGVATGQSAGMVDNCDPNTGRIKIPTRFAPICVPKFTGDNGGSTYRGVTKDTIKVVYFFVAEDAATDAVLTAANANDSDAQIEQQVKDWIKFYESHFQMYGRHIEVTFLHASGGASDAAAGRADAIKIADEIGAFASWGASNNTMVDELVARGVMCMCTTSQPIEAYLKWAPYVWTTLMASTQGYIHRAEYIGKRLAGDKAKFAGDPLFQQQVRKFGIIYYDTDDKSYKQGVDFFVQHLKDAYGVVPAVVAEYHGYPDTARSQEEARPLMQKLVQAGVTSVICVCDPFGPIFFTQEATRQAYQPEWIITGSALTDTSFFARLYDPTQWQHAFGISYLVARLPEAQSESYRLLKWQFGQDKEPSAPNSYGVVRGGLDILYNGIHLAGPNLNPGSFRDGMFAAPVTGENSITAVQVSYGNKGFWPWPDYIAFDDVTEIWWDQTAQGEDEIGKQGTGLYRYVDMGKRYMPTFHPNTPPKAFDPANTVTIYDKPPAQDQWPEYPSPAGK